MSKDGLNRVGSSRVPAWIARASGSFSILTMTWLPQLGQKPRPTDAYGVEIKPLLVATINRLPQRTIDSTLPTPGTICPGVTFQTPLGPSITAVPSTTSRSVQPSIVVGLVSGMGVSVVRVRISFTVTPVESFLASRDSGAVLTDF